MDWQNANWVRLFTQDSAQWRMFSWGTRSVLMHLLRVVDPKGWLKCEHGAKGVAVLIGAPVDVVTEALEELEEAGTIGVYEGGLHVLNFELAQATPMASSARVRKHRAVKRAERNGSLPAANAALQSDIQSLECNELKRGVTRETYKGALHSDISQPDGQLSRRGRKVISWPPEVLTIWEAGRDELGWQCPCTSSSLQHIERRLRIDGYTPEQLVHAVLGAKHPETWFSQKRCFGVNHIFSKAVNVDAALEGYRRLRAGASEPILKPARIQALDVARRYIARKEAEKRALPPSEDD